VMRRVGIGCRDLQVSFRELLDLYEGGVADPALPDSFPRT
jgi:hypothetical protein